MQAGLASAETAVPAGDTAVKSLSSSRESVDRDALRADRSARYAKAGF